jgi:hypothetical protein
VTRGTRPKKPSSSCGFAWGVWGVWGFWGLKTENRILKIEKNSLFPSRQQLPKKKKKKILIFFFFSASARTRSCRMLCHVRANALVSDALSRPPERARVGCFVTSARTHPSFVASARTRFSPRRQMVKTRPQVKPHPRGKRGRARTSG